MKQAKALKAKAWSSAGAGGSNALAGAVTPAKTLTLEDFDGDEEKFYEATYEQRAREQAAQRALVAATRKQNAEAAAAAGTIGGGTNGKQKRRKK